MFGIDSLTWVWAFPILIGVVVFIHEGGHYLAARMLGIKVTHFSIGFGPVLAKWKDRNDCQWQIALITLGGYVRMYGDENASSQSAKEKLAETMSEEEKRLCFHFRPVLHRAWVVFAGPLTNFVFGMMILTALYTVNGRMYTPPVVEVLSEGMPAIESGFQLGDRIVSIDGKEVESFQDLVMIVAPNYTRPMDFVIDRDGETVEITTTPKPIRTENALGTINTVGRIGIANSSVEFQEVPFTQAVTTGITDVYEMSVGTVVALKDIVTGVRPIDELGGPVKIAEMSGKAASIGWAMFFFFMAAISINLGVMNLLPIPVLDGGHLLFYGVEAVTRRPVPDKIMMGFYKAGFVLLISVMVGVTIIDISSFFVN